MAKSELIEKIRDAFVAQYPAETNLQLFCNFAAQWLADKGVVGVGHAASGLSLRMADGDEISLISGDAANSSAQTYPVNITTVKASPRGGILGDGPSVQVTGR